MSSTPESPIKKPRILCVDDEEHIVASLKRALRKEGEIFTALSSKEALEILKMQEIDLLITDMRMPEMTGADLLIETNKLGLNPARLLLTGHADMELLQQAINEGRLDRYLRKPWENEDLQAAVRQELHKRGLERRNEELTHELSLKNEVLNELNKNLEAKVEERTTELRASHAQLEASLAELKQSQKATARIFYNLLSLSGQLGGNQAILTGKLCTLIATRLRLDKERIGQIRLAGILGDLGLLCMDSTLRNEPWYALKEEQRQTSMTHPSFAVEAMAPATHLNEAATAIKYQFERFDGKGAPEKLNAQEIPIAARILTISRDYIRTLHGVMQKGRLSSFSAFREVERASGHIYDPQLVEILQEVIPQLNEEVVEKDERILSTSNLQPGMTLSRDLFNSRSILLLPSGKRLTPTIIDRLHSIEEADDTFLDVYVYR
jgi:adenylate cyclase